MVLTGLSFQCSTAVNPVSSFLVHPYYYALSRLSFNPQPSFLKEPDHPIGPPGTPMPPRPDSYPPLRPRGTQAPTPPAPVSSFRLTKAIFSASSWLHRKIVSVSQPIYREASFLLSAVVNDVKTIIHHSEPQNVGLSLAAGAVIVAVALYNPPVALGIFSMAGSKILPKLQTI